MSFTEQRGGHYAAFDFASKLLQALAVFKSLFSRVLLQVDRRQTQSGGTIYLFPQKENKSLDKGRKELNIFLFPTFPVYKAQYPGLYSNVTYAGFEGKFVQSLNKMAPLWLLAKHRDLEQVRMSKITMIIISWVINHLCDQYRF